ncbi:MAG: hypothetical protein IK032_02140 [Bacteroidales bacterium]|nr:hypothetical protein [Bacteroidales bacterium]
MTKDTFNEYVSNPLKFSLQDKLDIHTEKVNYPFCAVLQVLDLLSDKATSGADFDPQLLSRVSIQIPESDKLAPMLEKTSVKGDDSSSEAEARHLKEKIEAAKNKEMGYTASGDIDILDEINSFQDISFKTAPKSVILEKFLDPNTKNLQHRSQNNNLSIDELGKKSNSDNNGLTSETLAIILEKQGKIEKSIEIYEKLMCQNPEKNRIFAVRISELKNKLETT